MGQRARLIVVLIAVFAAFVSLVLYVFIPTTLRVLGGTPEPMLVITPGTTMVLTKNGDPWKQVKVTGFDPCSSVVKTIDGSGCINLDGGQAHVQYQDGENGPVVNEFWKLTRTVTEHSPGQRLSISRADGSMVIQGQPSTTPP